MNLYLEANTIALSAIDMITIEPELSVSLNYLTSRLVLARDFIQIGQIRFQIQIRIERSFISK